MDIRKQLFRDAFNEMITSSALQSCYDAKFCFRSLLESIPNKKREEFCKWVQEEMTNEYDACMKALQEEFEVIWESGNIDATLNSLDVHAQKQSTNEENMMDIEYVEVFSGDRRPENNTPPPLETVQVQFFLDIPEEALQQEKERLLTLQKAATVEYEQLLNQYKVLYKQKNDRRAAVFGKLKKDSAQALSILHGWSTSEAKRWSNNQAGYSERLDL